MKPDALLRQYDKSPTNLLAILHDLQNANERHYLSLVDLESAAEYLGLARSDVQGVATFYSMFSLKPRGKHIVRICQSPPCHLMGATSVSRELMKILGIRLGETTGDGLFTLEMSSCLGVCGVAPAMMIDDVVYGNLVPDRLTALIEEIRGRT
jgi:NADH:ubiquinone oxidoreductase subunit E